MWLVRAFTKEKPSQEPTKVESIAKEEEEQEISSIFIDPQPDLRYAKLPIIKNNKAASIPLRLLHFTESIFVHEEQLIEAKTIHAETWHIINLFVTDRQLLITPDVCHPGKNGTLQLYYGMIERIQVIEIKKQPVKMELVLKDTRVVQLRCVLGDTIIMVARIARMFGFPMGINKFYAFKYGMIKDQKKINGWELYSFENQFKRQGLWLYVSKDCNNIYRIIENYKGEICRTYPFRIVVPSRITDTDIQKCSKFRTKERLPALTYFYEYQPNRFSSLFRCSQNKVGIMSARCTEDEKMIASIALSAEAASSSIHNITLSGFPNVLQSSYVKESPCEPDRRERQNAEQEVPHQKQKQLNDNHKYNVKIYDARGYYAALGNKLAGKGFERQDFYECEIEFLNIPNIHKVRDSYSRIMSVNPLRENPIEAVVDSGWIDYIALILEGAQSVVESLRVGANVLIHCSDGWDRTAQLCSIAQLLIDPYYRTLQGFAVLFQKDWRSFGHKFRERTGQFHPKQYKPSDQSPIFIQFLDCVYQIMHQFPFCFQFNASLLLFLSQVAYSYTYGTFLTNSLLQAIQIHVQQQTVSIWTDILHKRDMYVNVFYQPKMNNSMGVLPISPAEKDLVIWREKLFGESSPMAVYEFVAAKERELGIKLKQQVEQKKKYIEKLKMRNQGIME